MDYIPSQDYEEHREREHAMSVSRAPGGIHTVCRDCGGEWFQRARLWRFWGKRPRHAMLNRRASKAAPEPSPLTISADHVAIGGHCVAIGTGYNAGHGARD